MIVEEGDGEMYVDDMCKKLQYGRPLCGSVLLLIINLARKEFHVSLK